MSVKNSENSLDCSIFLVSTKDFKRLHIVNKDNIYLGFNFEEMLAYIELFPTFEPWKQFGQQINVF